MHTLTAYDRRETLSIDDLGRLRSALIGEVERYRAAIQSYNPEKMREHGAPFLAKLEYRVEEITRILEAVSERMGNGGRSRSDVIPRGCETNLGRHHVEPDRPRAA